MHVCASQFAAIKGYVLYTAYLLSCHAWNASFAPVVENAQSLHYDVIAVVHM